MRKKARHIISDKKGIRPTSGLALGALFNSLVSSGELPGGDVLDLFAGTGTVSLEAFRRGASSVVSVESDGETADFIRAALARYEGRAEVIRGDVRRVLPRLAAAGRRFSAVFADPPYHEGWCDELPPLIEANWSIVAPGGVFVMERSSREQPAGIAGTSRADRRYGETVLSFYRSLTDN